MQLMGNLSSPGRAALLVAAACIVAQAQQEGPGNPPERRARPADISISCRVNEAARTAKVTIANRTNEKLQFLDAGPLASYEVIVTTIAGHRLSVPEPPKLPLPKGGTWHEYARGGSIFGDSLGAGEQRTHELYLSEFVVLPKEGGTFRIRIGRGLFVKFTAGETEPTDIIRCEPAQVTFPVLKGEHSP